ncbi:hypothetical protein CDD81_7726 [Ophiocordyceps australis]|uniref:DNA replication factor Cdt1 C-terminal domain-containing protein n=1 Tax=Ophiocordyceps australis TaxID=1399860 RepID=A0A2C5Y4W9_9HYPO|nr:hypothetical protein CDD81_7726 [Ophiocordyceps australis]
MARKARTRQQPEPPATQAIDAFVRSSKSNATASPGIAKDKLCSSDLVSRKRKATALACSEQVKGSVSTCSNGDDQVEKAATRSKRARRRSGSKLQSVQNPPALLTRRSAPATKGKRVAKAKASHAHSAHGLSKQTPISKARQHNRTVQTKLQVVIQQRTKRCNKGEDGDGATRRDELPRHLSELVCLNRSFLKAMALHAAHSGHLAPVDTRRLATDVSRSWGKRQVTVEDFRRCIAIQGHVPATPSPYIIVDYGHGKVCVELAPGMRHSPADLERLHSQFIDNLHHVATERAASPDTMDIDDVPLGRLSLSDLPQAAVEDKTPCSANNPLLAKGQRALAHLKSGLAAKQEQEPRRAAHGPLSKLSVLDRIRLKQEARNDGSAPAPPTAAELMRKAALERVVDVAATLSMLSMASGNQPRQAFAMNLVVERLRDSLQVPISKDGGAACVRLIAGEVAPEWIRVVTLGGRDNVVISKAGLPADRVLRGRVDELMTA